jgi:hypothetical protein
VVGQSAAVTQPTQAPVAVSQIGVPPPQRVPAPPSAVHAARQTCAAGEHTGVVPEHWELTSHCTQAPADVQTGAVVGQSLFAMQATQPMLGLQCRPLGQVPPSPHLPDATLSSAPGGPLPPQAASARATTVKAAAARIAHR